MNTRRKKRTGYTLIEMVVSSGAATMLMVGMASTLVVSSQAFNSDGSSSTKKSSAADVQADISADLHHATGFTERTPNAVTFMVPDRNGDGQPETIRYAWSGTAGDPLTYAFNNGTAVNLVTDVQAFNLSYLTRTMQAKSGGGNALLHLKLDETTGTTALDSSGNGHDGTLINGPLWQPGSGTIAGALLFDGSNDSVEIPHTSQFLIDDGSIDFWFNANVVTNKVKQGLITKDSNGRGTGGQFEIYLDKDKLKVIFESTTTKYKLKASKIAAGQWYHVQVSFGLDGLTLTLNDTLVDSNPYTGGLGTTSGGTGNIEPIVLGARQNKTGTGTAIGVTDFFAGLIDDVKMNSGASNSSSNDSVLMVHNDAPGGKFKDYKIKAGKWCAQYFKPTLNVAATSWSISRIRLVAKYDENLDGVMKIQVRTADANLNPTATVLDEVTLNESALSKNSAWVEFSFNNLQSLNVNTGYCIVVKYVSGSGKVAKFQYEEDGNPMTANTHFLTSSNSGATWNTLIGKKGGDTDLRFFVYGNVSTN